jgi:hypothetical protein
MYILMHTDVLYYRKQRESVFLSEIGGYRIRTRYFWKSMINQNLKTEPQISLNLLQLIELSVLALNQYPE